MNQSFYVLIWKGLMGLHNMKTPNRDFKICRCLFESKCYCYTKRFSYIKRRYDETIVYINRCSLYWTSWIPRLWVCHFMNKYIVTSNPSLYSWCFEEIACCWLYAKIIQEYLIKKILLALKKYSWDPPTLKVKILRNKYAR